MMFPVNHGVMAAGADSSATPATSYMAVTGEGAQGLKIYDTADWSTVAALALPDCSPVAFSPDGALLAVGYGESPNMAIVDTSTWTVISGTPSFDGLTPLTDLAWSPDGSLLAVSHYGASGPFLTVIDTNDWSVLPGTPSLPSDGRGVAFSRDGTQLAVSFASSPSLRIYNTSDWSQVPGTPSPSASGFKLSYSADGQYLAMAFGGSPGHIVLNTSDWSEVSTPYVSSTGYAAVFAPDSSFLSVSCYSSGSMDVFDTSTWSHLHQGTYGGAYGRDTDVSADSSLVALVGYVSASEGLLKVLRASDWTEVSEAPDPSGRVFGVSFSPAP